MGILTEEGKPCALGKTCKQKVHLWPENEEAMRLIAACGPGLISPNGTLNAGLIETVFRVHRVPAEQQPDLLERFNVYLKVLLEHLKTNR